VRQQARVRGGEPAEVPAAAKARGQAGAQVAVAAEVVGKAKAGDIYKSTNQRQLKEVTSCQDLIDQDPWGPVP